MTYNERLQQVAEQMARAKQDEYRKSDDLRYMPILWEYLKPNEQNKHIADMLPLARIALELAAGEVEAALKIHRFPTEVEQYILSQGLKQQPNNG
jgi:hypothetical protein